MRVAVEPVRPTDLARLEQGLLLLNRADPFVEVTTLDSGEHVIGAAGAYFCILQTLRAKEKRQKMVCGDGAACPLARPQPRTQARDPKADGQVADLSRCCGDCPVQGQLAIWRWPPNRLPSKGR